MELDVNTVAAVGASALGVLANGGVLTWFLKGYLPRREKETADRETKKDETIEALRKDNKEDRRAFLAALQTQGERYDDLLKRAEERHREDQLALNGRLDGIALGVARVEVRVKGCPYNQAGKDLT